MLLTIIGLALLFIILANVVLFCLETEAIGIIISIIGILSFLSGGHIFGIIAIIAGICLYNHAKGLHEEERRKSIIKNRKSIIKYHQRAVYELIEKCWNHQTGDFNWSLWFDEEDAIFYDDSDLALKKMAQSELQSIGKTQIRTLNMYLDMMKNADHKDYAMKEIKAREHIVLNLEGIFSAPFFTCTSPLQREVQQYRQDLYDYVLYKRKPLNQQKLSSMIRLGQAITS